MDKRANFAAGAFLVIFRPFKVGDFICAGGATGTVHEIGLFATSINTPDNVMTIVGNNKIFSDNIQNFSTNAYRRVDLVAPAPDIEILKFEAAGRVLVVRFYCNNDHYGSC